MGRNTPTPKEDRLQVKEISILQAVTVVFSFASAVIVYSHFSAGDFSIFAVVNGNVSRPIIVPTSEITVNDGYSTITSVCDFAH